MKKWVRKEGRKEMERRNGLERKEKKGKTEQLRREGRRRTDKAG